MNRIDAAADRLISGEWATPERLRLYAWALILCNLASIAFVYANAAPHGGFHFPIGADFTQVWVAGKEALAGTPDAPYDLVRHGAAEKQYFGPKIGLLGWHYPPYFLVVAAALALLPYLPAYFLYQIASFALFAWAFRAAAKAFDTRAAMIAAVAFPGFMINLVNGQNGFLTAGLLTLGLLFAPKRPVLAGALLALLAYKPHFGLVVPLVLLIEGRWRAIASGLVVFAAMNVVTTAIFGWDIWRAFVDSFGLARRIVEDGAAGFDKIQSWYSAARLIGLPKTASFAVQSFSTAATLAVLAAMWLAVRKGRGDRDIAVAASLASVLLTTPYCLDYDMVALGPACALAASAGLRRGFAPWEVVILAFTFAMLMMLRTLSVEMGLSFGAPITTLFFAMLAARQWREWRGAGHGARAAAIGAGALPA